VDDYYELKEKVHGEIIDIINQEAANGHDLKENKEAYLLSAIEALIEAKSTGIPENGSYPAAERSL